MALTLELKKEYADLANRWLDSIPIEKDSDYKDAVDVLNALLTDTKHPILPDRMAKPIDTLSALLNAPSMYVVEETDYKEFTDTIRQQIEQKILTLSQSLS